MTRIFYILFTFILIGCGASKPTSYSRIQTKKTSTTSHKQEVYKPKPVVTQTQKTTETTKEEPKKTEELVATSNVKVTKEVVLAYVNQFKQIAQDNMRNHGIPASIALAQGILESGAGTGRLATIANNHFGIKCHKEWTGESVSHDDDALGECFRKYTQPQQSYTDHSLFLTSRPWYQPLFKLEKNDYKGWANGLKKAGYATDPKYPAKLIGIIERYQLQQYDAEVLGLEFSPQPTPNLTKTEEKPTVTPPTENGHIVAQGETLYSISKKYNTTVEALKTLNNLKDNAISIGQTLIIK